MFDLVEEALDAVALFVEQGLKQLEVIRAKIQDGDQDVPASRRALNRLRSRYGGIAEIRDEVKQLLKKLDG